MLTFVSRFPFLLFLIGLYNDALERQNDFSSATVSLVDAFLSHLEQPVCLIAHYGNGFDYPLLKAELKRINQPLSLDIFCVDSIDIFRSLDCLDSVKNLTAFQSGTTETTSIPFQFISDYKTPEKATIECPPAVKRKSPELSLTNEVSPKREKTSATASAGVKRVLNFEDTLKDKTEDSNDKLNQGLQNDKTGKNKNLQIDAKPKLSADVSFKDEILEKMEFPSIDEEELLAAADMAENAYLNETKSKEDKNLQSNGHSACQHLANNGNDVMSSSGYSLRTGGGKTSISEESDSSHAHKCKTLTDNTESSTALIPSDRSSNLSTSASSGLSLISTPPTKKSFKLAEIYKRLFGHEPSETHRAEGDCITLLKCAQGTKDFVTTVDKHAELFSGIKPGY